MRLLGYDIQLGDSPALARRNGSVTSDITNPAEWLIRAVAGVAQSATGITVTPLKALGVACVFGCVRVLSDTLSTLPLEVHQRQGRRRRIATEHPLFHVLNKRPNEEMTSADWRWAISANMSLYGVGYSEVLRDSDDDVVGVYPIESNKIDFRRDPVSKKLRYYFTDKPGVRLIGRDMLHIKNNTFNGLTGVNTTIAVRECIALALAMQDNAAKFFGNGSRPNGVLKHPQLLSKPAQDRLKQQFEDEAGGQNLYRLMLLEEGLDYVATRSENKDSQFQEARDAQNLEICRVFGVPPHKVGIVGSQPRANVEEENIAFVMDVIRARCVKMEQEMDVKLFTEHEQEQGYCTYFDLDALMRGNAKMRFEAYGQGRQWGILSANDCRMKEQLDDVTGGDVLLQPINMIDAAVATEYQMLSAKKATQSQGGNGGKQD